MSPYTPMTAEIAKFHPIVNDLLMETPTLAGKSPVQRLTIRRLYVERCEADLYWWVSRTWRREQDAATSEWWRLDNAAKLLEALITDRNAAVGLEAPPSVLALRALRQRLGRARHREEREHANIRRLYLSGSLKVGDSCYLAYLQGAAQQLALLHRMRFEACWKCPVTVDALGTTINGKLYNHPIQRKDHVGPETPA